MKRYRAIAAYYDAENVRHGALERDVPFFLERMPRGGRMPTGGRRTVLELAVGTGRAAIPIAQAGHRVVGVDFAPDMLEIARRKRDAVGLDAAALELVKGDILTLDLGRTFDWVCVFFNTFLAFTTLEDQDRAMRSIVRHLKPGGRVWLDIFYPDLVLLAQEERIGADPCAFYVPRYDRTVCMTTEVRRGDRPQVQRVTFRYAWFDDRGFEHRQRTEFDMTWLMPREVEMLVQRHGMRVEQMYGDYDGSVVTPDSPRIIAQCTRASGGRK